MTNLQLALTIAAVVITILWLDGWHEHRRRHHLSRKDQYIHSQKWRHHGH